MMELIVEIFAVEGILAGKLSIIDAYIIFLRSLAI